MPEASLLTVRLWVAVTGLPAASLTATLKVAVPSLRADSAADGMLTLQPPLACTVAS